MKRALTVLIAAAALAIIFPALPAQVVPRIFSVSPNFAPSGNPSITITVSGEHFHTDAIVLWNSTSLATTYVSSGKVTASVTSGLLTAQGTVQIAVQNPGAATSPPSRFFVLDSPPVYSWLPRLFTPGTTSNVTLTGDHFLSGSEVVIDGRCYATSTTVISLTQMTAQIDGSCLLSAEPQFSVFYDKAVLSIVPDPNVPAPITTTLSPAAIAFGNQAVNTTSAMARTFTLSAGQTLLRINSISISPSGPFAQTNDCPAQLTVGASCDVFVTFAPTSAVTSTATLSIADNASDSPQTAALSGTGVTVTPPSSSPAVQLNPSGLNFGSVLLNTPSAPLTAVLKNIGTATLNISAIAVTGSAAGDFTLATGGSNCAAGTVAASATCNILVTYQTATAGGEQAAVTITDDAADSPESLPLTATGYSPSSGVTITSVSPASGGATAVINIWGTGFAAGSTVSFSNASVSGVFGKVTVVYPSTHLEVTVPAIAEGTYNLELCVPIGTTSLSPSCATYSGFVVTHSVVLTWHASVSPGIVGYYVYRATASGGPYTHLNPSAINALTYTDPTVANSTTYYYVVTAFNSNGVASSYSNQVTAVVGP